MTDGPDRGEDGHMDDGASPTSTEPDVPAVIDRYLRAHDRRDTDAALSTFAANATVVDDGQRYVGADRIREWLANTSTQFSSRERSPVSTPRTRTRGSSRTGSTATSLAGSSISATSSGWRAMRSRSCSSLRDAPGTLESEFARSCERPPRAGGSGRSTRALSPSYSDSPMRTFCNPPLSFGRAQSNRARQAVPAAARPLRAITVGRGALPASASAKKVVRPAHGGVGGGELAPIVHEKSGGVVAALSGSVMNAAAASWSLLWLAL